MPRFHARYIARNGRRGTVRLDAIDLASLSEHIESSRKGYIVEIRRVTGRSGASARVRIASSMLLAALDSLELMLVSGVRINTALRTLAECAPPGNARRLWTEAVRLIEESGSFGESLRQFPKVFNEPMVGVITAHETAGRLADGVRHVRDYVAQMQELDCTPDNRRFDFILLRDGCHFLGKFGGNQDARRPFVERQHLRPQVGIHIDQRPDSVRPEGAFRQRHRQASVAQEIGRAS